MLENYTTLHLKHGPIKSTENVLFNYRASLLIQNLLIARSYLLIRYFHFIHTLKTVEIKLKKNQIIIYFSFNTHTQTYIYIYIYIYILYIQLA